MLFTSPTTSDIFAIVNERLTKIFFDQFSGVLANIPYVKIIVDREDNNKIYFLIDQFF